MVTERIKTHDNSIHVRLLSVKNCMLFVLFCFWLRKEINNSFQTLFCSFRWFLLGSLVIHAHEFICWWNNNNKQNENKWLCKSFSLNFSHCFFSVFWRKGNGDHFTSGDDLFVYNLFRGWWNAYCSFKLVRYFSVFQIFLVKNVACLSFRGDWTLGKTIHASNSLIKQSENKI